MPKSQLQTNISVEETGGVVWKDATIFGIYLSTVELRITKWGIAKTTT